MTLIQVAAALLLGVPALWLVWRHRRRVSPAAMMFAGLAGFLALPSGVHAAEIQKEKQNYTLAEGETVKKDLIVMSGNVRIDGTVEGDLIAFSQSVTINGRVTGDLIVFTQRLRVTGQVDGDIRTFCNTGTFEGTVAKNVMIFAETIEVVDKAQIGGSLTAFAKVLTLDGRVARDMMAFGDNTTLNGFTGGDVAIGGKHLTVGDTAEIQGKAEFRSNSQPEVSSKAKLASAFVVSKPVRRDKFRDPEYYLGQCIRWGVSFVFGIVVLLLMPQFFRETVGATRTWGPALGFGAISFIVVPILAVIACITFVGIAVGIGSLMMYIIAVYSAKVVVGTWLGMKLLGNTTATGGLIGRMALGVLILFIGGALPYGGFWITLGYWIFGLGAIVLAVYNRMRGGSEVVPAAPAPAIA